MNKDRKRVWWTLFLLIASGIAILAGYYLGTDRGAEKKEIVMPAEAEGEKETAPKLEDMVAPPVVKEIIPQAEEKQTAEMGEPAPPKREDECARIDEQVREFFAYLNKQAYVQQIKKDVDTYERFKALIKYLSSNLPIPAGEQRNGEVMKKNIFFFFRTLKGDDLRLIKEIMSHEADTLEMNLDILFKWAMMGNQCPDPEKIRPSLETLYHYAGFFVNTIGGRAYLFRRPTHLRLIYTYYSMLIIYEADMAGQNRYGIDIAPQIAPIIKDIGANMDLLFKDEYINKLNNIRHYYRDNR
jgi:hypothetical protein